MAPDVPLRLPTPRTPLIGRERERTELGRRVLDAPGRLTTLTGPGGCGKTRLALQVAADLEAAFPDGIWWVELAALADAALVTTAVAAALGVSLTGGSTPADALVAAASATSALLVLDNCEHLLDACASLAERLLGGCPTLRLLATSRDPLQIAGERQWRVPPLATPDSDRPLSPEALAHYPAVQLFVARARAVLPSFRLTPHNAGAVAGVCARLDGIPLALELAAARVRVLTVEQLLVRLDDPLRLLVGGSRAGPTRQQTLRATLDWSHDLLTESERALLRRLAVFAGGYDLEAVEAVCAGDGLPRLELLELLTRLVDASLVVAEVGDDAARYRLLEPLRAYALERLEASGEAEATRARHAAHYLALAEAVEPQLFGPKVAEGLARLEEEHDNLRTALGWTRGRGRAALGLRLAGALARFWSTRGYFHEGREWLDGMLGVAMGDHVPAAVRAKAQYGAGILANVQGDLGRAAPLLEQAVALYRAEGDALGAVRALNTLGGVADDRGDLAGAVAEWESCLALARATGDVGEVARALANLGEAAYHLGDLAGATARQEEALALARRGGRKDVEAFQLGNLAILACRQGDLARANALQRRALEMKWTLGDLRQVAISLGHTAAIVGAAGEGERAARLLGAAAALRTAIGAPQPPLERADADRAVATAREALGERTWAAAWAAGRALAPEQAIAEALAPAPAVTRIGPSAAPEEPPCPSLTRREREVAGLLAGGVHSDRAIAVALTISEATAGTHVQRLLAKLSLHSRWEVAAWANAQGRPA